MNNIKDIVLRIKIDTNYSSDITYRRKIVCKKEIYIIYNEPLTSSDKISDFIIRSLDRINKNYNNRCNIEKVIFNEIDNFKIKKIYTYRDICYYLNYGFTVMLVSSCNCFFVLETKRNLARSISNPQTENTLRGSMDCFVEDMQTNIGLIRRRIKNNNLWSKSLEIGRYTKTIISIIYINGICNERLVMDIYNRLKKIDIDGIINSGTIKNLIENENKNVFPTILSTERPDRVCDALLDGKIIIMVDSSSFALIVPIVFNDLFLSIEDSYSKSINITITRIIRYLAFFITLFTPSIYLALTTINQDILPYKLLISFTSQRALVPFPSFIELFIMLFSFEVLRECDLRSPTFTTSALSTVGALILGDAAVNAGIVSPIMIIVAAITSLSALIFTEPEVTNGLRWYRLFLMIVAVSMGFIGILMGTIFILIELCSTTSFNVPYFSPFSPFSKNEIKNSIIKYPINYLNKRDKYLSLNRIRLRNDNNE